ncbi:hypothetical protein GYMLUDRAFT_147720, partial [Collybiopsis luxurians FD-317 M1]
KDAYFNSDKVCLEGTRVQILDKLSQWVKNTEDNSPQMFLLCGAAGTGKSAISHAIGKQFKAMNYLGAFFAFNRTFAAERNPVRAVQTIACDLAKQIPKFRKALIKILEQDSNILRDCSIEEQWKKLILEPAQAINESRPVVIIFDALDESGNQGGNSPRDKLISLWLESRQDLPKNFYIFMTSQLEQDINKHLYPQSDHLMIEHMDKLENTANDISKYIIDCITKAKMIKQINESQCSKLAEKAEGYFQWAATVCNELCNDEVGHRPEKLFKQFMELAPGIVGGNYPLDPTYKHILEERVKDKALEEYGKVMSQVLALYEPLSQHSLQRFQSACYKQRPKGDAEEDEPQVNTVIKFLGSLFTGVHDISIPVRPVHTSVRDFLLDSQRSGKYAIDVLQGHTTMTLGTIGLMIEELHFNMCKLESSHVLNSEVKDLKNKIDKNITSELRYACCHWDLHLSTIQPPATEDKMALVHSMKSLLEKFTCSKLSLFWMEVLSILDRVNVISRSISKMTEWIVKFEEELKAVGEEIRSFLFIFGKVLSESTPHIYVSALPFIPKHSKLQKIYVSQFTNLLKVCHGHRINWPHLQAVLQKHTGWIWSVAFSPDGKKIVSVSFDCSVRIWDAETGEPQGQPLQGHTMHTSFVNSVAFSPDGKRIVSGSWDDSVRIWDAETGEPQGQPLQEHTSEVNSVAFSPDGKRIVSGIVFGSHDMSVWIWDAETGPAQGQPLQGHASMVLSVAFSPDGKRILSGSNDNSVRIWDAVTGEPHGQPLQGHTSSVYVVAFSPDGKRIASGSDDHSIRIWNAETGEPQGQPLQGHTSSVLSTAFSPDGKRLLSGSYDGSVLMWDIEVDKLQRKPQGHTSLVHAVAFSSDGTRIVSGSHDTSIRIWNLEATGIKPVLEQGYPSVDGWLQNFDTSLLMWILPEY